MPGWKCPDCNRQFRRAGQAHECAPAMSLAEFGHRVDHPTMTRKVIPYSGRFYHAFNLWTPDDFDDRLKELLTESYFLSPD